MDFLFWNNWLLLAGLTPALWAVSCLIDVCCIGERVFQYPSDGPIISGLFCVLPLTLLSVEPGSWEAVTLSLAWPALLAGMCYFLHLYFVFRALFTINDATCSEIFNTLTVLVVPIMAFAMLGERLAPISYVAIVLAVLGVLVLIRYHFSRLHRQATAWLTLAVLSISLTMVLQAWVFERLAYWNGIVLFAMGTFMTALFICSLQRTRLQRIVGLCRRFWKIFLLAELLQLAAVLASQRATDIGPSVSFVAVVECSLPLFVMLFSSGLLLISERWKAMSQESHDTLLLQTTSIPVKLTSVAFILSAIVMVQAKAS